MAGWGMELNVPRPIFRRLVRQKNTGQWFTKNAELTSSLEAAHDFPTLIAVTDFCRYHQLRDTELVLKFSEPRYDVVLDIC
jgi:hypothetical protein